MEDGAPGGALTQPAQSSDSQMLMFKGFVPVFNPLSLGVWEAGLSEGKEGVE